MYLIDHGKSPDPVDLRKQRLSQRLGYLSQMCDAPLCSVATVSTCVPEDLDLELDPESDDLGFRPRRLRMKTVSTCVPDDLDFETLSLNSSINFSPTYSNTLEASQITFEPSQLTFEHSQLTSSPSAISRTMSAPSLGISCESPLAFMNTPPRNQRFGRDWPPMTTPPQKQAVPSAWTPMITPPRKQAFQRELLDPKGSPLAEQKCRDAAAQLDRGKKSATSKLGASDPYVEGLRTQAIDLRRRADNLKWNRLVSWHDCNVRGALHAVHDGAHVSELEAAVTLAHSSELGPGHRIVGEGKQQILRIRKQRRVDTLLRVEEHTQRTLDEAIYLGDLSILATVIDEAANAIGSAHPFVESAREALKEQRSEMQRSRFRSVLQEHHVLMLQACATNDVQKISERIWATAVSELGVGHPIVDHGKNHIRNLKQQAGRAQLAFYRQECMGMLNAPEIYDAIVASEAGQCQW